MFVALLPLDRSGFGQSGPVRSGPDRIQIGSVLGPAFGKNSVFGRVGPVRSGPIRSWTDEHPYLLLLVVKEML